MLALIAGMGDLPPALIARLPERPLICAMVGFVPSITPDITFRIEHLGGLLADLRGRGVTEVCLAGAVQRPDVNPAELDAATAPLAPRIAAAIAKGDDGALREVIGIFEEAGMVVRAAHDIAPDLLPRGGVLTDAEPGPGAAQDAVLAELTVVEMGAQDIGQSCLVRDGRVLAREGQDGTDAMLARFAPSDDPFFGAVDVMGDLLGSAAEWLSGPDGAPVDARGALLFKAPKPGQDRRADLPVIGPQTAKGAAADGLAGIVIEADGVIVLHQDRVVDTLNAAGLFLWVRPKGGA